MNSYLRQATAGQIRALGPFISDTDFKTVQTGLTIANTDIKLVANGAASANKNSGGGTHRVNGIYGVTWDATDTATVGELDVSVLVAGALVVWTTYVILEEAIYDALFAASATGLLPANVTQIDGQATSGNNATLNLKQLNIVNSAGSALIASSTGSNGHGAVLSGNGSGEGLKATGGATGNGAEFNGGATSGNGLNIQADNDSALEIYSAAVGDAVNIYSEDGHGMAIIGDGTGKDALRLEGNGSGAGLMAIGGTTGPGMRAAGGSASGAGMELTGTGGSADLDADITGNVTGNLSGSVGSVTGNVGGSVASVVGAVGSVTGAVGSVTGNVGGNVVGTVASVVGAVGSVTGNIGGNLAGDVFGNVPVVEAAIAALNNLSAAQVNAEVLDVLNVDTFAEPTGVPPATASLQRKISQVYMALRNGVTVTATDKTFLDDGGVGEFKKALSDDGTVYTEGEATTP